MNDVVENILIENEFKSSLLVSAKYLQKFWRENKDDLDGDNSPFFAFHDPIIHLIFEGTQEQGIEVIDFINRLKDKKELINRLKKIK